MGACRLKLEAHVYILCKEIVSKVLTLIMIINTQLEMGMFDLMHAFFPPKKSVSIGKPCITFSECLIIFIENIT